VKDLDRRLACLSGCLVEDPARWKGKWDRAFGSDNPVYLEVGCGKGQFLCHHASLMGDANFIGLEGQRSVILRALEKADRMELDNIRFAPVFLYRLDDFFREGELAGVYLNFSDPWPKERHAGRRLTHRGYLRQYEQILGPSGSIQFKTDNEALYRFTLDEIRQTGFDVLEQTDDLHHSRFSAKDITSEYEDKFREAGKNIYYVRFKIRRR